MTSKLFRTACAAILIFVAKGQSLHHSTVMVMGGAAVPVGNDTNYLSTAPLFGFRYGYRFNRYLQAEAGFQMAFGAASNQNLEQTDIGTIQGKDHEFMIPLGARVFIPTPFHRVEVSAGGGGVHLHYSETIPSGGGGGYGYGGYGYGLNCYTCTSRGGWGGYGLANVRYFLDENHTFHVGSTVEYMSAATSGPPVGNVPGNRTSDHWTNVSLEFGLSF